MSSDVLASGRAKALSGDRKQFDMFFNKMLDGFAYHKIVVDKSGKPIDYVFLEVNHAFEEMTGLKRERIIGKKVTEVLSGIEKDPADWIGVYGKVALTGKSLQFENHAIPLGKWYKVSAYCPEKGYFIALFEDITESKKAEHELWQAKKDWERTFDSVPDFVAILDNQFRIVRANRAMAQQLGVTPEKAIGLFCYQCVHGLDSPPDFCPHAQTAKDGKIHQAEVYEPRLGGDFLVTTTPLKDEQGCLVGSVHVARNITELMQREREIENVAKFPSENPNPVFRIDGKGTILFSNASGASVLTAWSRRIGERSPEYISKAVAEALASNRRIEVEETYGDTVFSLLFVPITREGYVNIYANDITERKKAEEVIVASEKKYRRLFETSQDGIMARDLEGRMIDCNQAYSRMIGYSKKELTNVAATDLLPEKWWGQREKIVKEVLETGGSIVFEREYRRKDGVVFPASVRTWRLTDEKGNMVGTWSMVRDITQQKELQEKLQRHTTHLEQLVEERTQQLKDSERLAAIGATAGMVGHDIRNPLQAIISDVYLAKTELASIPESDEKKNTLESLEGIEKNTEYINKIVADLQDFARPLKPNAEEADLKIIIEDLLKKNGLPENIKVTFKIEAEARKVVADCSYINRIMYNLVNNAVQAMPNGGKLTIRVFKEANDTIITVKDTGVGIPEKVKGKLFTPMFTTKSKGQGFGLPVVKRMTEALRGTVNFESQEGKGTTFMVRLPPKTIKR